MSLVIPSLIGLGGAAVGLCACKAMSSGMNIVCKRAANLDEGWQKTALKIFLFTAFGFNMLIFSISMCVLGTSAGILIAETLFITGIPFLAEIVFGGGLICAFIYQEELKHSLKRFVEWIGFDKADALASKIQNL